MHARARQRRRRAAQRFRPDKVKLLLVAEAPPAALDRYFYFTDVREQDSLFRYVARAILKKEPTRENKPQLLAELRDRGVFLIDLSLDPRDASALAGHVPGLLRRARQLNPATIVLMSMTPPTGLCATPVCRCPPSGCRFRAAGSSVGSRRRSHAPCVAVRADPHRGRVTVELRMGDVATHHAGRADALRAPT